MKLLLNSSDSPFCLLWTALLLLSSSLNLFLLFKICHWSLLVVTCLVLRSNMIIFQSCNASICSLIGWNECQMSNTKDKLTLEEKEELCFVGCRKFCLITYSLSLAHWMILLSRQIKSLRHSIVQLVETGKFIIWVPRNRYKVHYN